MIEEYGDELETITLVRGDKGRFEVTVDGEEVYSKSRTKRHANPGEVVENIRQMRADHGNGFTYPQAEMSSVRGADLE